MSTVGTETNLDILAGWLDEQVDAVGKHSLRCLSEIPGSRDKIVDGLRELCRSHYVSPEIMARRLAEHGAAQTAALLKEHVPESKKARSADLGEILATELAEKSLGFRVPIRRLRWKDGREMALRGDDIIGVKRVNGRLVLLKGESKSRSQLTPSVVEEAAVKLDEHNGRPARHSVLFVAERLSEQGANALAKELEDGVLTSFRGNTVEHVLLTLSGNSPRSHLSQHLSEIADQHHVRHAVGVQIVDHGAFIERLFSEM